MKTAFKAFSLLFVICSLLMLAACSGDDDIATISIKIGDEPGKAAVSVDQLTHTITLAGPTGTRTLTVNGAGSAKATVVAGLWDISVEAYFGNNLYAVGSSSADVKAGRNTDVLVQMTVVWVEPVAKPSSPSAPITNYDEEIGTWAELDTYIGGLSTRDDKIILITQNLNDADGSIYINNGITVSLFATSAITISRKIVASSITYADSLFVINTGGILNLGMAGTPAMLTFDGERTVGSVNDALILITGGTLNMYAGATLQNNENLNPTYFGGAVRANGINSTFNMEGGLIKGNRALNGGGVCFDLSGSGYLFMKGNATIEENYATETGPSITSCGGGVYFYSTGGVMEMSGDSQIINNGINGDGVSGGLRAETTKGGGVYFRGSGFLMKENALVGSNKTEGDYYGYGGGAYFENVTNVTMEGNASIVDNITETSLDDIQGGGVHFTGTNLYLKGSVA